MSPPTNRRSEHENNPPFFIGAAIALMTPGPGVTTAAAQDPLTFAVSLEANFKNRQT
jgi:hypothetical protein